MNLENSSKLNVVINFQFLFFARRIDQLITFQVTKVPRGEDPSVESRGKKRGKVKERKRESGVFLCPLTLSFSLAFPSWSLSFAPSRLPEGWNTRRLACGCKKEGHQNYDCLIQGSRARIIVLSYPNLNWWNKKFFKISNKCKELRAIKNIKNQG